MAGLLPQLLRQGNWLFANFRPGAKPFQALMRALLRLLFPDNVAQQTKELKQWLVLLREKEVSLQDVIERILDDHEPGTKILIVADQFEELYTLCQDKKLRHNFLDQLLEMIAVARMAAQPSHLFLLTLRSDFLGQAQNDYVTFTRALHSGRMVLMEPMDRAGLREAIKYPALNAGVAFERHLVKRIVDDIAEEPGQLPLLEFALELLWKKRENSTITLAAYEEIGRVAGALAQYADQQYEALKEAEQEQARQIFLKLVEPGEETQDTRRLATRAEIGEKNWPLVIQLASKRLLVTNQNADSEEMVEVIHEALIWGWKELQTWIDADRVFLTQLKRLRRVYQQWQEGGQKEEDLLRGTLLEQAISWLKDMITALTNEERTFILKSFNIYERDLLIVEILRGNARGQDLSHTTLKGTNLSKADLYKTILRKADLSNANLRGADLRGADLRGANLIDAELSGADLRRSKMDTSTQISDKWRAVWVLVSGYVPDIDLTNSDLSGVELLGVDLRQADLMGADLSGASLREVDLSGADLREADLSGANLSEAFLMEADLSKADLSGANLARADLSEAILSEAILSGAILSGADLREANLIRNGN